MGGAKLITCFRFNVPALEIFGGEAWGFDVSIPGLGIIEELKQHLSKASLETAMAEILQRPDAEAIIQDHGGDVEVACGDPRLIRMCTPLLREQSSYDRSAVAKIIEPFCAPPGIEGCQTWADMMRLNAPAWADVLSAVAEEVYGRCNGATFAALKKSLSCSVQS